jgi:hypothetical protein
MKNGHLLAPRENLMVFIDAHKGSVVLVTDD